LEFALGLEKDMNVIVNAFAPIQGLDISRTDDAEKFLKIMEENSGTREFWALSPVVNY